MKFTENINEQIREFNPNNEDIEVFYREAFVSTDGEHMKNGFYFFFTEYKDEGIIGPFIDENETCPACHKGWLDHEFAVPAPYCP